MHFYVSLRKNFFTHKAINLFFAKLDKKKNLRDFLPHDVAILDISFNKSIINRVHIFSVYKNHLTLNLIKTTKKKITKNR